MLRPVLRSAVSLPALSPNAPSFDTFIPPPPPPACSVDPNDQKKTACYDIDVEVDDTLKTQMNSFLLSTASQQEIAGLDNKVAALCDRWQLRGGTLLQIQARLLYCFVK